MQVDKLSLAEAVQKSEESAARLQAALAIANDDDDDGDGDGDDGNTAAAAEGGGAKKGGGSGGDGRTLWVDAFSPRGYVVQVHS